MGHDIKKSIEISNFEKGKSFFDKKKYDLAKFKKIIFTETSIKELEKRY